MTKAIPKLDRATDGSSQDVVQDLFDQLKPIIPEAFADGKVDLDVMREALGDFIDDRPERYSFVWNGKTRARRIAQTPSTGTLRAQRDQSTNWDSSNNLVVEGDNLEVLKLLQKSYHKRVKCVYIDPPYNTGGDLIYPDRYQDALDAYLKFTGQIDEAGFRISPNSESSGRFHTNWLNMMYPRLKLARNLLSDDGVIFVSISDVELANLRVMMNEIFGEENYVNCVSVKAKPSAGASGGGEDKRLKKNVEFLLIYARNRESPTALDLSQAFDETELMTHIASMKLDGKSWKYTRAVTSFGEREFVTSIEDGDGNEIKVFRHVGHKLEALKDLTDDATPLSSVYVRYFESVFRDTNAQSSIRQRVRDTLGDEDGLFSIDYVPRSGRSKGQLTTVYYKGSKKDQLAWLRDIASKSDDSIVIRGKTGTLWADFNWNNVSKEGDMTFLHGKKPIAFIQRMLALSTSPDKGHLVLDFFAGSGSTGHAVMDMNSQDAGDRRFILVQLPEPVEDSEFNSISEICRERLRRSALALCETNPELKSSLGFRAFSLDRSNIHPWDADFVTLDQALLNSVQSVKADRTDFDVLYELLLKFGLDLSVEIEERDISNKKVFIIGAGALVVCLADDITLDVVEGIALLKDELQPEVIRVVLKDAGFKDDVVKTNAVQILRQRGIDDVKSL